MAYMAAVSRPEMKDPIPVTQKTLLATLQKIDENRLPSHPSTTQLCEYIMKAHVDAFGAAPTNHRRELVNNEDEWKIFAKIHIVFQRPQILTTTAEDVVENNGNCDKFQIDVSKFAERRTVITEVSRSAMSGSISSTTSTRKLMSLNLVFNI